MQVTVEALNPVTRKINIEIPAEQVDAEIEKVYANIQKKAKLQGFRPGKAPMQLIKRTYSDTMRDEVMRRFFDKTLFKAMDEHRIEPIDSPTIESDQIEQGSPFKYSAQVEVMPEAQLTDYTGFEVTKEKFVHNQDKIETEIERMRENMAQLVPLDEDATIENGHAVSVDYTFSVEGYPDEDSNAEDATVEIGSNKLMPELEEKLVGMKRGESKTVSITVPEGYSNPDLVGKEGVFQITVKEIKRKELPELDDEFAQQFGDYDTMEQLRAKMVEYNEKQETDRIENTLKERVIQILIEKNPIEVPQSMVKRQLESMLENLRNRLKSQRMSLEMMGLDEEGFRTRFRDAAADKVKGGLLLLALVEKENITVTDEDLAKRYERIAANNPAMLARIKEYYDTNKNALNSLIAEIKEDKAVRFLIDHSVITEVEAAEQKAE